MFIRPARQKKTKLDLTLSKWKTLLPYQSTEVSGWIHASHLVKCLKLVRSEVKWKLKSMPVQTSGEVRYLE